MIRYDGLAVDDAAIGGQAHNGIHDPWVALGEIVSITRKQPYSVVVLPRQNPEPVVLDLVQPIQPVGRRSCRPREARLVDSPSALDAFA